MPLLEHSCITEIVTIVAQLKYFIFFKPKMSKADGSITVFLLDFEIVGFCY